ncbi:MAG: hypothetical protein PHW10_05920 [Candidatus Peribacteraceae bacterium]|nr:hypothetical protein [Candidatus Peribacteraceae bacterium]
MDTREEDLPAREPDRPSVPGEKREDVPSAEDSVGEVRRETGERSRDAVDGQRPAALRPLVLDCCARGDFPGAVALTQRLSEQQRHGFHLWMVRLMRNGGRLGDALAYLKAIPRNDVTVAQVGIVAAAAAEAGDDALYRETQAFGLSVFRRMDDERGRLLTSLLRHPDRERSWELLSQCSPNALTKGWNHFGILHCWREGDIDGAARIIRSWHAANKILIAARIIEGLAGDGRWEDEAERFLRLMPFTDKDRKDIRATLARFADAKRRSPADGNGQAGNGQAGNGQAMPS